MPEPIGQKSLIPNPALKPFEGLIGEWRTTGTHPMVPGITLRGRVSFAWHEGGAFLVMHSQIDNDPRFPSGVAIFGSDDNAGTFTMIYFDERGISRRYDVIVGNGSVAWHRDDPKLAQKNTLTIEPGGKRLIGKGEMSQNGGPWGADLSLTYERVAP